LLETMIQERMHIVLVMSTRGIVTGLVTLEDIMEELVGEIEDEFDRLPTHTHALGTAWIMGGGVLMAAVFSLLGLPNAKSDQGAPLTLGEWCILHADEVKGGEVIEADGIKVIPRKFRRKRILEATVAKS
ncbi:MAG: hypothetical protein HQL23_04980, partial [Candidatus Omnitrophica bacterium]|nr:hypothetical protein [Candidatus Omnitrophota bacterium]